MTEPSASSNVSSTTNNNVLRKSAQASAALGEDDDEPPSSGSRSGLPSQIKEGQLRAANTFSTIGDLEKSTESADVQDGGNHRSRKSFLSRFKFNSTRVKALFTPAVPVVGPPPTFMESAVATLKYTPLNVCLAFIPVSWALHYTDQSATLVFVFSALAIIPLAALLGFGTEQIAWRTSQSVGGLLNATLGNVIEMIIAGIALTECDLELVQSSLMGGLISNMLLVLGMAFLVGGYRFHQQEFQPMAAQLNSSLLTVAVISLIIPVALHEYVGDRLPQGEELPALLELSRGSSILLILIYFAFLYFQFITHSTWFLDTSASHNEKTHKGFELTTTSTRSSVSSASSISETLPLPATTTIASTDTSATSSDGPEIRSKHILINTWFAIGLLVAVTALAYVTAENLVGSLNDFTEANPSVSKEWITFIVIPVISNAAEHVTAVVVARKGKFDLAMSVAVGSCIQIALFVIPVLVLVAWGMGKPLTLFFDPMETIVLFFSVLLVKFSIEGGKSHWMSGVALVGVYFLIALSFWNFPDAVRTIQGVPLPCVHG